MKYRTKKQNQIFCIQTRDFNRAGGAYVWLRNIISSRVLPNINNAIIITKNRISHYYIHVPVPLEDRESQVKTNGTIVSLDPGVRTFMTCYDPQGRVVEWGKGDFDRITRLSEKCDNYRSQIDIKLGRAFKQTRNKLRRKVLRIFHKVRCLISELHYKLAKWLMDYFDTVLLPTFDTSQMIAKKKRKIGKKTVRAMLTWRHYEFKQFLIHKSREYCDKTVVICDESYTSKTCGNCGTINDSLGGNKVFICNTCSVEMDRDHNGARNILLKYLSETNVLIGGLEPL